PFRRWTWFVPALLDETVVTGIQLYLPALFVHFFALFPESRAPGRGNRWVSLAYSVASLIFLPALMLVLLSVFGRSPPSSANDLIQAAAAIWFAAGLVIALGLFVASYRRAGSADTRRRLRVALLGTGPGPGQLAQ